MIQTRQLTKRFGPILAVDRLDLDVREGDIYGFLGANGSGKTTTVRVLLGLVLATSGEVDLMGKRMPGSARSVLPLRHQCLQRGSRSSPWAAVWLRCRRSAHPRRG